MSVFFGMNGLCFLLYVSLEKDCEIVDDKECSNNQVQRSEEDYVIDPAMFLTLLMNEGVLGEKREALASKKE